MRKFMSGFVFFIYVFLLGCSCGDAPSRGLTLQQWLTPDGRVKVLSTIAMIDDLVKQVGGEYIDATVLIKGDLDPHSYQLVKGDDEKLAFADLIFYNGLGLEHGPSLQGFLAKNSKAIPLGNKVMQNDPKTVIYINGQIDPHIWMDISLWAQTVEYMVAALSQKDPVHAENYRDNGKKLAEKLLSVHAEVKDKLQQIPSAKRYLVTSHDAFNYFTRAYLAAPGEAESVWRQRFMSPEGLAPESQISTTDIQALIAYLSQHDVRVLFPESNVNRDSIRKIVHAAKEKGLDVKIADVYLYADAMGQPGGAADTYIKMMVHNAQALASQLKFNGG